MGARMDRNITEADAADICERLSVAETESSQRQTSAERKDSEEFSI